jgi:hypothetical protein
MSASEKGACRVCARFLLCGKLVSFQDGERNFDFSGREAAERF